MAALRAAEERSTAVAQAAEMCNALATAMAEEREVQMCDIQARFDARESRSEDIARIAKHVQDICHMKRNLAEHGFSLQQAQLELKNRDLNDRLFSKGPRPCGGHGLKGQNCMRATSSGPRQREPPHDIPSVASSFSEVGPMAVFRAPTALGAFPGKQVGDRTRFADRMRQTLRNSRSSLYA